MSAGAPTTSDPSPGAPLANRPWATVRASHAPRSTTLSKPQAAVQEMAEPDRARFLDRRHGPVEAGAP